MGYGRESFHPGTRVTYKKEFETAEECLACLGKMYAELEQNGYVYVRDYFPSKTTKNSNWAWTAMNLVNLYQGGKVFEIKNYPKLLCSEDSISNLHFHSDYTITALSQYGHIQTIDDLRKSLKDGSLKELRGIGPVVIEDVTEALDEWYYEHGA